MNSNLDGTPYEVKVSRTVWSGGKVGDNIKYLPITIANCIENGRFFPGGSRSFKKSSE